MRFFFEVSGHVRTRSENGVAANPAYVSGCIWTARRDRGLLLFGGHVMVLVVVWWSFAGTWEEEGEEVVWGHLLDLGSTFRQHQKMIQSTILAQSYQRELSGHSLRRPERHECH